MKNSVASGRRGFLKTVALAGGMAQGQGTQKPAAEAPKADTAPKPAAPARPAFQYPRTYSGRQLAMLAFPLGGIAAGSISLGGRGQLCDWEIFNRPDKGKSAGYAFPAIWAQVGNAKPVVRVLEAKLAPPYEAASGLNPASVSGLVRLDGATFTGEYPLAAVAFRDRKLPVKVTLEAFTPIMPLEADDSGLPVAVLRYRVKNPNKEAAKVSIAYSLDNPVGVDLRGQTRSGRPLISHRVNEFRSGSGIEGLFMTNPETGKEDPLAGSFALCVLGAAKGDLTRLSGWPRAKWWASPLLFWDDFSEDGKLGPEPAERNAVGSVCVQREIAPGAEAEYTFLLAWHFPNRTAAWCGWSAPKGEENTIIGNYYATRFRDAWEAAEYTAQKLPVLERRMRQFLTAVRETTVPAPVKEAAMANVSTLATQVCFRTADGKFWGFEGAFDDRGCCFGNCSHVWNYEAVTQHLFPALARSQRMAGFETAGKMEGVLPIRVQVPEGKQTTGITAIDGTMGQMIRACLDWRLSGDREWLRSIWPNIRKAMEFAWVQGGWDGDRDGVSEGVQHNTFDVEFYGPNPMCGIYYLGGLRACEEMARALGDNAFAENCRALYTRGSKWIDGNLFNGQYYIQKVQGIPADKIAKPLVSHGGAEDPEHPDFQAGEGCLADQFVGQYVAMVAGLGSLVDTGNIRKTLASIYKYNYRRSLKEHNSVERIYALDDEAGLLLCDYGPAKRPRIPFPYFSEVWTGFEYEVAALMIHYGMEKEGIEIITNTRLRYDGERRNPWDELECGHHYVRAMASWSGILALNGFRYQGAEQSVSVAPKLRPANFSSFWSTATGWGTFSQTVRNGRARFRLSVLYGKLPCRSLELGPEISASGKSSAKLGAKALAHKMEYTQKRAQFIFAEPVELAEGDHLELEV
ncbi:MAG: non-lysosomal glucosylceramidase [Acidobacteria bacterium]|nr:non-lysosomal glucosylceramidase [Acidobacteriota bacterium]